MMLDSSTQKVCGDDAANPQQNREAPMKDNHIDDAELTRLGIERVQTEAFLWGGYRYSNLSDAVAAARRTPKR